MSKEEKKNSLLLKNKRVFFDYEILDKYEAGIVLFGTEVKSLRESKLNLNGSFCIFKEDGLYVKGMDISIYDDGSYNNHDPKRDKKLLLHKNQLRKLRIRIEKGGLTIVPISVYLNETGYFKMEIGLARGRNKGDKRDYIIERETRKEMKDFI